MHESRRHFASTSGFVQRMPHMLAVGPPRSLMVPLKSSCAAISLHLAQHRLLRAALHHAALVRGDRAEGAAAEAAAHDRDRVADHLERRDLLVLVDWVRPAAVGQVVRAVELLRASSAVAGGLCTSVRSPCACSSVAALNGLVCIWCRRVISANAGLSSRTGLERRKFHTLPRAPLLFAQQVADTTHVAQVLHRLARIEAAQRSRGPACRPARRRAGPPSTSPRPTA